MTNVKQDTQSDQVSVAFFAQYITAQHLHCHFYCAHHSLNRAIQLRSGKMKGCTSDTRGKQRNSCVPILGARSWRTNDGKDRNIDDKTYNARNRDDIQGQDEVKRECKKQRTLKAHRTQNTSLTVLWPCAKA